MLGDLPQEILGTEPKYPPINNLDYLTAGKEEYDNYPSDNNPVRIQPKLSDLWNPNREPTGVNLVPNQTPCPMRTAEENPEVVSDIIRTAKKAMMTGLKGAELASHLRSRFSPDDLMTAKDEMLKLSEEQGLLGNVYIDASAFSNPKEAESFLAAHRNRLAQDIVVNDSKVSSEVIGYLANKFRKHVVAEINYDEPLFNKYKDHLVDAGRIDNDFIIDSKEALRKAFMAVPKEPDKRAVTAKAKKVSKEVALKEVIKMGEKKVDTRKTAEDELTFRRVLPILKFARRELAKGKTGSDLKEILRGKFASIDLNDAARYLAVVLSSKVNPEHIEKLITSHKVSAYIGNDLKKIIKDNPLKVTAYKQEDTVERPVGVQGHFHVLSSAKVTANTEATQKAVEALRKGFTPEEVKGKLLESKMSNSDADSVVLTAVKEFNESSAGTTANVFTPQPKKKVVADLPEPQTLPDAETIIPETQEFINFYKGAEFNIDVDDAPDTSLLEIDGLESKSGLDGGL